MLFSTGFLGLHLHFTFLSPCISFICFAFSLFLLPPSPPPPPTSPLSHPLHYMCLLLRAAKVQNNNKSVLMISTNHRKLAQFTLKILFGVWAVLTYLSPEYNGAVALPFVFTDTHYTRNDIQLSRFLQCVWLHDANALLLSLLLWFPAGNTKSVYIGPQQFN